MVASPFHFFSSRYPLAICGRDVWYGINIGGFAVKEKSLGNFVNLFAGALIIFSNTLIVGLPKIIYIIPFTSGVDFTSSLYVSGKMDLSLLGINLIINAMWLILGLLFFNYSLKKEKSVGSSILFERNRTKPFKKGIQNQFYIFTSEVYN